MKHTRMLLSGAAFCLFLIATAGYFPLAAKPRPAVAPPHPIAGVWVNPDYDGQGRSGRVSYEATGNGTYLYSACDNADGSGEVYTGKVVFKKTWRDAKGFRYGIATVTLDGMGMSWDTLDRISPDGNTLEVQPGAAAIDPKNPRYSVYTRKK
jgi:hypothetical protein